MTRERRLAIEMWRRIEDKIGRRFFGIRDDVDLCKYKDRFVVKHVGHEWLNSCYWCHYINTRASYPTKFRCEKCPLYKADDCKTCNKGSFAEVYIALIKGDFCKAKAYARRIKEITEGKIKQ